MVATVKSPNIFFFLVLLLVMLNSIAIEGRPFDVLKSPRSSKIGKSVITGLFDGLSLGGIKHSGPSPPGQGHKFTNSQTLGGIKDGPSPGQGHNETGKSVIMGLIDGLSLGGIKHSGPSPPGQGHKFTNSQTLGGIKDGSSPVQGHNEIGKSVITGLFDGLSLGGIKHSGPSPPGQGHKFNNSQTLGGIKDGLSPGQGHNEIGKSVITGLFDGLSLGGIKHSGPSPPGQGHKFTNSQTLGGIKDGPSPGHGHNETGKSVIMGLFDGLSLGGIKHSGPSPPGQGHKFTNSQTLGGIKDGPSPVQGHNEIGKTVITGLFDGLSLGGIKHSDLSPPDQGHKFTSSQTLGGIKDGPGPGQGHNEIGKSVITELFDGLSLGGIKHSGPSPPGQGHKFTNSQTLGGIKDGPSPGQGHKFTNSQTLSGIKDGPNPCQGHKFIDSQTLGGIKDGPSPVLGY